MEGAGLPPHYVKYHKILEDEIDRQYALGSSAKSQGSDPSLDVESPLALDLADRVAKLLEVPVAERLRELLKNTSRTEIAALILAKEVASGKYPLPEG